jgi:predicted nucleic acid-binding protein
LLLNLAARGGFAALLRFRRLYGNGLSPEKAKQIEFWIEQVAESHNILVVAAAIFRSWARFMRRQPDRLIEDAMIAAAAVHNLIVATRDIRDCRPFGVKTFNPFSAPADQAASAASPRGAAYREASYDKASMRKRVPSDRLVCAGRAAISDHRQCRPNFSHFDVEYAQFAINSR